MVARELTLSFADLVGRPLVERPITMTCVSNPVGGDLISTGDFIGVPLRDILLEAGSTRPLTNCSAGHGRLLHRHPDRRWSWSRSAAHCSRSG